MVIVRARDIPVVFLAAVIGTPLTILVFSVYRTSGSGDVFAYILLAGIILASFVSAKFIWNRLLNLGKTEEQKSWPKFVERTAATWNAASTEERKQMLAIARKGSEGVWLKSTPDETWLPTNWSRLPVTIQAAISYAAKEGEATTPKP